MKREIAKKGYQPDTSERDFMHRRLRGFLSPDVGRYSIEHLMMESYMQGMRDAAEAIEHRGPKQTEAER